MGKFAWWTSVALGVALCATVRIEQGRLGAERARSAQVALSLINAEAARDSTRVLVGVSEVASRLLGDSVRVYQKRIVQVTQQRDALDRAIGDERVARYALTGRVDSLEQVVALPHRDSAEFHVRQAPYTIDARLDSAQLALRVALDPIPIEARLTCSKPDSNGIRSASVIASAPSWATLTLGRVQQSPELCASPALVRSPKRSRFLGFEPLVIGGGRIVTPDGRGGWGFFAGSGVRIWI